MTIIVRVMAYSKLSYTRVYVSEIGIYVLLSENAEKVLLSVVVACLAWDGLCMRAYVMHALYDLRD